MVFTYLSFLGVFVAVFEQCKVDLHFSWAGIIQVLNLPVTYTEPKNKVYVLIVSRHVQYCLDIKQIWLVIVVLCYM